MTTATPTKPCVCGGVMEHRAADSDDSGPRGTVRHFPAAWACADCWRVEPEEKKTHDRSDE